MHITHSAGRAECANRTITSARVAQTRHLLTQSDRNAIARLLADGGTRHAPNPVLLEGLLRQRLRSARPAPEVIPTDLIIAGSRVTYKINGEGARSGILSIAEMPWPGHIMVTSLLGATLIGMRSMQKAPLLREDGRIDTVVVLEVDQPEPNEAA